MNEFTKGAWFADEFFVGTKPGKHDIVSGIGGQHTDAEWLANAQLIAAAGTSANRLAEAGYDAQAVMEALPEIVAFFKGTLAAFPESMSSQHERNLLARIRPEAADQPARVCMECGAEMDRFEDRDGGGWSCPNVQCGCVETDEMETSNG